MRQKIVFREQPGQSIEDVYSSFIISQTSKGVSQSTINNYHSHFRSIAKHLDTAMPFDSLTKRDLEQMVVSMRMAGLAHNTIATYIDPCPHPAFPAPPAAAHPSDSYSTAADHLPGTAPTPKRYQCTSPFFAFLLSWPLFHPFPAGIYWAYYTPCSFPKTRKLSTKFRCLFFTNCRLCTAPSPIPEHFTISTTFLLCIYLPFPFYSGKIKEILPLQKGGALCAA